MDLNQIFVSLAEQGPIVLIMGFIGYFLIKYFIEALAKKEEQNQQNINSFIGLIEKVNDTISGFHDSMVLIHPKIDAMSQSISDIHGAVVTSKTRRRKTV